jgi:superoxide dismutase
MCSQNLEPDHLKEDAAALHSHLTTQSLDEAHQQHLDTVLPHLDALTKAENVADVQAIEQNADHGKLAEAFTTLAQHIPRNRSRG